MHADQIAAVERVREKAGRKGVDLGIGWLVQDARLGVWFDDRPDNDCAYIHPDAAALIITGSLAKWLAGQGHSVVYSPWAKGWFRIDHHMDDSEAETTEKWVTSGDHLVALIAATNARLDELPDKEKA